MLSQRAFGPNRCLQHRDDCRTVQYRRQQRCRHHKVEFQEAKLLLKDRIFRIDVTTKPGEFSLDEATPDKIAQLMNLGRGEAVKRETLEVVKIRFVTAPKAPPFMPLSTV